MTAAVRNSPDLRNSRPGEHASGEEATSSPSARPRCTLPQHRTVVLRIFNDAVSTVQPQKIYTVGLIAGLFNDAVTNPYDI
jgi:hypothetical protein